MDFFFFKFQLNYFFSLLHTYLAAWPFPSLLSFKTCFLKFIPCYFLFSRRNYWTIRAVQQFLCFTVHCIMTALYYILSPPQLSLNVSVTVQGFLCSALCPAQHWPLIQQQLLLHCVKLALILWEEQLNSEPTGDRWVKMSSLFFSPSHYDNLL